MTLIAVLAKIITVVLIFKFIAPGRRMWQLLVSGMPNYIITISPLVHLTLCGVWMGTDMSACLSLGLYLIHTNYYTQNISTHLFLSFLGLIINVKTNNFIYHIWMYSMFYKGVIFVETIEQIFGSMLLFLNLLFLNAYDLVILYFSSYFTFLVYLRFSLHC